MKRCTFYVLPLLLASSLGYAAPSERKKPAKSKENASESEERFFGKYDSLGLVLSPGIWRTTAARGYEISALYVLTEQGAFSAVGLAFGETYRGQDARYLELEIGGSGMLLGSMTLGVGRYQASWDDQEGIQSTFSAHLFVPIFGFVRGRWSKEDDHWKRQPFEFGFMLKAPIPVLFHDRSKLKFFEI